MPITSNITPELAAALAKLQADLPDIERDRTVNVNQDHPDPNKRYSYSYATLAYVSKAILPKMAALGLSFTAYPGSGSGGGMCVSYFLLHEGGGYIGGEFPISGDNIQALGGKITYVKRYCLLAVTGLAAEEDDESRLAVEEDTGPRTAQRRATTSARADRAAANTARRNQAARPTSAPPSTGETVQDDGFPAPADPDARISRPRQVKLMAQFSDIGIGDRDTRLHMIGQLVGRTITTANDLTDGEGHDLIAVMDAIAAAGDRDAQRTAYNDAARAAQNAAAERTHPGGGQ